MVASVYTVEDRKVRTGILRDELKTSTDETCVVFVQTMAKDHSY